MFLTRLLLNQRNAAVRRDLADCRLLHSRLLSAFPDTAEPLSSARSHFGLLYRVDESAAGQAFILVQSQIQPDWTALPAAYLLTAAGDNGNPSCKRVDAFYDALSSDMALRFRLKANPTRKIDTKSGPDGRRRNGKRVELRGDQMWQDWLIRKAVQHGFSVRPSVMNASPDLQIVDQGKVVGAGSSAVGAGKVTMASVLFNGHLKVTDVDLFRDALAQGIGSGKAYGFGLLSVARVS